MGTTLLVPAGRPDRKLLNYVSEIKNLRTQGLSVADIHRTFAAQGIEVGYSSVFREVWRLEKPARKVSRPAAAPLPAAPAPDSNALAAKAITQGTTSDQSNVKKKSSVDEFFDNNTHDPFLERLLERKKK